MEALLNPTSKLQRFALIFRLRIAPKDFHFSPIHLIMREQTIHSGEMNTLRAQKTAAGKKGFVAVELLAVLALLILLTGIILPAASNLKHRSTSLRCINNHRQIVHAWNLYAQENNGQCANNFIIPETERAIVTATFDNWAKNVMVCRQSDSGAQRHQRNLGRQRDPPTLYRPRHPHLQMSRR